MSLTRNPVKRYFLYVSHDWAIDETSRITIGGLVMGILIAPIYWPLIWAHKIWKIELL